VSVADVVCRPERQSEAASQCRHCGNALGWRKLAGAKFCSAEHERLDAERLQGKMLKRLQHSRTRLLAAFRNRTEQVFEDEMVGSR
jgi:hypothetical protein